MLTDVGEFIVGAYLQLIEKCDKGLGELDVIGLNFKSNTIFVCEVTMHIRGLLYQNNQETAKRITKKHNRQMEYAKQYKDNFEHHRFMFWSPYVPRGYITENLGQLEQLELVINGEYKERVKNLQLLAKNTTHDARNPFFRMLQIMEHMKDWK